MNAAPDVSARRVRILIVDDAPDNRELLEVIFEWEGFATQTASSGEEALASMAESPPDLVLLDLILPGLSGCEVVAQMKSNGITKGIPVMIMSGMLDSATRRRVLSAGADHFVEKPLQRSVMCQQIRDILGLAPRSAPASSPPGAAATDSTTS